MFGLYGDLMNVEEYEVASPCPAYIAAMVTIDVVQVDSASTSNLEGSRKELRSSDPELETIPYRFYHNSLDDTGILLIKCRHHSTILCGLHCCQYLIC